MQFYFPRNLEIELLKDLLVNLYNNQEYVIKTFNDRILIVKNNLSSQITSILFDKYAGILRGDVFELKEHDDNFYLFYLSFRIDTAINIDDPFHKFECKLGYKSKLPILKGQE